MPDFFEEIAVDSNGGRVTDSSGGEVTDSSPGNGIPGNAGNGKGPSSSSTFIRSSGYNWSKSSNPGASGIGPKICSHFSSKEDADIGFSKQATAPADNAAS